LLPNLSFLDVFRRNIVKTQDNLLFLKKGIVRWDVLSTMQPKEAKSVEKLRRYYRKTEKKSEKSSFCVDSTLFAGVHKASFNRKTTGLAFIFYQKKSFKQHTSEIRGGRCNCLVSWRGMTQKTHMCFGIKKGETIIFWRSMKKELEYVA